MQGETILVIDDSEDIRDLLTRRLTSWGHTVLQAADGGEGFEIIEAENIHLVITDWKMPLCSGVELCKKIRETPFDRYVYVILLTGKTERADLAEGMAAGADDFVTKPFAASELKARINAGLRILQLERWLREKERHLNEANDNLKLAYAKISEDLHIAAKLQTNLLPPSCEIKNKFCFESLFYPSRFLAGDIYNLIPLDDRYTVCYVLDVAGKGVPAALLSFTLSKLLMPLESAMGENRSAVPLRRPVETATRLNRMFQKRGNGGSQYFTMNYAVIDHEERRIRLTQAGHPPAILLSQRGEVKTLGEGGYPIGIFSPERAVFHEIDVPYQSGDRLYLYSDGATETFDPNQECFSEERMIKQLIMTRDEPLLSTLEMLKQRLINWACHEELDDDLTLCALEFF